MGWKQDEKLDGGGCSDTCKAIEKIPIQVSSSILFWRKFTLTSTRDLVFKFLVVDMASCQCRRSPCKFSGFTWFSLTLFSSTGPCRSTESQQDGYEHGLKWQWHRQGRSRGLVLGMGVCGVWLQASKR